MKRNWDTIRKILIAIESQPDDSQVMNNDISDKTGIDIVEVSYHCKLLIDAGLIQGNCSDLIGAPITRCLIDRLTWEGHELIDKIRNDTVWNSIKIKLRQQGLDMSLDIAKTLATTAMTTMLSA